MAASAPLSLEDVVTAVYCALDDALLQAGVQAKNGKLIARYGPPPEVDDREVLCLAVLQELLGFESDNEYHLWLNNNPIIQVLFPRRLSRQNFADRRALLIPILEVLNAAFCDLAGEGQPPFYVIDSHPVDVCRPIRALRDKHERLEGMAQKGYCAALKRWFFGVREHLIMTPQGRIASTLQIPGNRHDVQGLYALLKTEFQGVLLGDNAYWPRPEMREQLTKKGIDVLAASRSNWKFQYPPITKGWHHGLRARIERRIGLFDEQFHANRTQCRSYKHYLARRLTKAVSHNCSRHTNAGLQRPEESVAHFRSAA